MLDVFDGYGVVFDDDNRRHDECECVMMMRCQKCAANDVSGCRVGAAGARDKTVRSISTHIHTTQREREIERGRCTYKSISTEQRGAHTHTWGGLRRIVLTRGEVDLTVTLSSCTKKKIFNQIDEKLYNMIG